MDVVKILITFALFAILLYGILKKANVAVLLIMLGTVTILACSLITNVSPLGEATTGNLFFDTFEYIQTATINQFGSAILIVATTMGYAAVMSEIGAANLFAYYISKPLKGLKKNQDWIIIALTSIICYLLSLVVQGMAMCVLSLVTIYPAISMLGLSNRTANSAMTAGQTFLFMPTNALLAMGLTYMGAEIPLVEFCFTYLMKVTFCVIPFAILFTILSNKHYDKIEPDALPDQDYSGNIEDSIAGTPKWYAILPIFPLLFVIIFNGGFIGGMSLGVSACIYLAYFVVAVLLLVTRIKNINKVLGSFFTGMGNCLATAGAIFIGSAVFGQGLTMIGGLEVLLGFVSNISSGSFFVVVAVAAVISAITAYLSGNVVVGFSTILPSMAAMCNGDMDKIAAALVPIYCLTQMWSTFCPASAQMQLRLVTTKNEYQETFKRQFLPYIGISALHLIFSAIFLF